MSTETEPDSAAFEFMYACPIGLVQIDRAGDITMMNPHAVKHLLPLAPESARGSMSNLFAILENCAPELRNLLDHFPRAAGQVCENHRIFVDLCSGAETARKVLACTLVKFGDDRSIATFSDVTAQVEQEHRLKLADIWFSSLLDGVNDYAVLTVTADGIVEGVNESFTRQTQHAFQEVQGRPLSDFLDGDHAPGSPFMADQFKLAGSEGWSLDEVWQQRCNGERYWCQRLVVARPDRSAAGEGGFVVVLRDVARQARDSRDLRRLLTEDQLTGASNRSHFIQTLEGALRRGDRSSHPVCLVMIDIDHFKQINDRHGHPAGDEVLRAVAQRCMAVLRPGHVFARIGGEEFAVVLPGTTLVEALAIAERLRAAIAASPVATKDHPIAVTASLGCAVADAQDCTFDELMQTADDGLYMAKRSGRNRVGGTIALAATA